MADGWIEDIKERLFENSTEQTPISSPTITIKLIIMIILTLSFLLLYLCLSIIYLYKGVNHEKIAYKLTLKCLPLISLIVWFTLQWSVGIGLCSIPVRGMELNSWYFYLTLLALVASVTGDALLNLPLVFPLGVLSFGLAQILYAVIFGGRGLPNSTWTQQGVLFLLVGGICAGIFLAIRKRMFKLFKEHFNYVLIVLIGFYFAMIATMLWAALLQHVVVATVQSFFGLLGGVLFFISDLCIVLSGIYSSHWVFKRRIVVMITYYVAQLCIAVSTLLICWNY